MLQRHFYPPLPEYEAYLKKIWGSGQLTNQGPLLKEFEQRAREFLAVKNFHFVGNGTLALQLALRSLDVTEGEVITTPFSYVATVSSILWERCDPVFVDINPETFCIDANKIELAITRKTKAIMPVHVFGHPCEIEQIESIAKRHNLKVIYDAAHAFGVEYKGRSLLSYGDISVCSFHATKIFHTIEGGCVIAKNVKISNKVELMKRFGHNGDNHFCLGINAKASELQAAMGLCNLKYLDELIEERKKVYGLYNELLSRKLTKPKEAKDTKHNYSYYPVVFDSEKKLLDIVKMLGKENIYPRRYFYPSLNTLPYLKNAKHCPISEDIARRVLCLPLYAGLNKEVVEKIGEIIKQ